MKLINTTTGVTAMNAIRDYSKPIYVVEELGATFTFTNLDIALHALKTEILGGAEDVKFFVTYGPSNLDGDELADWVASNG